MTSAQRLSTRSLLRQKFSEKNSKKIELCVFTMCTRIIEHYDTDMETLYSKFAYEKIGEFFTYSKPNDLLKDLNASLCNWESSAYAPYRAREKLEVLDRVTGPIVKSGEFKCKNRRCPGRVNGVASDKCVYYQMQTRSADEGSTTYVVCSVCGDRYTFS